MQARYFFSLSVVVALLISGCDTKIQTSQEKPSTENVKPDSVNKKTTDLVKDEEEKILDELPTPEELDKIETKRKLEAQKIEKDPPFTMGEADNTNLQEQVQIDSNSTEPPLLLPTKPKQNEPILPLDN